MSVLLENEGRGLMLSWDVATAKLIRQHLEQAGLVAAGSDASSTRPIDVANAGNRVPMLIRTDMMRRVGTRATYTMSVPSSTDAEVDSWIAAASCSRCGCAISGSDSAER